MRFRFAAATFCALSATLGCKSVNSDLASTKADGEALAVSAARPRIWTAFRREGTALAALEQQATESFPKAPVGSLEPQAIAAGEGDPAVTGRLVPDLVLLQSAGDAGRGLPPAMWQLADIAKTQGYDVVPVAEAAASTHFVTEGAKAYVVLGSPDQLAQGGLTVTARAAKPGFDGAGLGAALTGHAEAVAAAGGALKTYILLCDRGFVVEIMQGAAGADGALKEVWEHSPLASAVTPAALPYHSIN